MLNIGFCFLMYSKNSGLKLLFSSKGELKSGYILKIMSLKDNLPESFFLLMLFLFSIYE